MVAPLENEPGALGAFGVEWAGHDFLANAKNDTIWKKVLADAEQKGISVSLAVLDGLLKKAAQKYLGLE